MKLGLQPILAFGFAAAVVAVVFVGIQTSQYLREEQANIRWASHNDDVVRELDQVLLLATSAQSAVRGFAITGSSSYLKAYNDAVANADSRLEAVRALTSDNPLHRRHMVQLQAAVRALLDWQHELVKVTQEEGEAAARERIHSGIGMGYMQAVRDLVDAMQEEEQRFRPGRWAAAELRTVHAQATLTALVCLLLALLATCFLLVRKVLAQRHDQETRLRTLALTLDERVHERTAQLEAAQRNQAQLAAIVESSIDAIVSIDRDGNFATWNHGAERLFGYGAEEIVGRPLATIFPPDSEAELRVVKQRLGGGQAVQAYETVRRHKDGHPVPVLATASPIRDTSGNVIGGSGILRDISDRKRLETEVLRVSDYEQQRLGHDLHDGIGQQLTALELMLHGLYAKSGGDASSRQLLDDVGDGLRNTIREVRLLARGLAPFILDSSGLQSALAGLVSTGVTETRQCRLRCEEPLPQLQPNAALQLYRIAQEAFNNALKHSGATEIDVSLRLQAPYLRLTVRDNGHGCSETDTGNPGLGLQIMRYRAGLIGAEYAFDSKPGKGVTITCSLPLGT